MTEASALPPVSRERPLFTWLIHIGVFANLAVVVLIAYVVLAR